MTMRVSTPDALRRAATAAAVAAATAALLAVPAHAEDGAPCAGPDATAFPLTTRLHGGPDSYRAGGGYGTWYLDLTNTTDRACAGVHPVVVLVDSGRALRPGQPHLDFYADGRPHPVRFETTDEDELVGVFTDGPDGEPGAFPGFTVAPRETLTVRVRLALTSDTAADDITANAALVQRHGDDGDWIGQSNDYRFAVEGGPRTSAAPEAPASETPTEGGATTAPGTTPVTPPAPSASPSSSDSSASPRPTGTPSLADEAAELARSGLGSISALLAATACFVAAGIAVLLARRRN
ncbi:hypothetical protein [Streptomyces sp. DSM 15324]|uniref:hypothetical protein n=1 Tax=Streptomyces sp. DSM 15324 TaxID=1739111 RepID=UPI00074A35C1|nr:hypothetical protein [Streptomyces sp. DSM 15324]KUO13681.1 hypothetical protein AQJ58_00860 [Streptomyces sp. DSM 15324]